VVKLPDAKHGFILLPRRWVVERSFAWMGRFRRLARDYERLPETLAGLHLVACTSLPSRARAYPTRGRPHIPVISVTGMGKRLIGDRLPRKEKEPYFPTLASTIVGKRLPWN
jgi:hypothetical protein